MGESRAPKEKNGVTVHWALHKPASDTVSKCPVVLFFHGCGERGKDLEHLPFVRMFLENVHAPCFVIAPQCPWDPATDICKPEGHRWAHVDWRCRSHDIPTEASVPLTLAMDMLDELLLEDERADARRVHVCGLSMGGFGAWDAISRWPTRFASAVVMCGGADQDALKRVLCKKGAMPPVWAFHGDSDEVVQPQRSNNAIDCLRSGGMAEDLARLTKYPRLGHDCWSPTFQNPLVAV